MSRLEGRNHCYHSALVVVLPLDIILLHIVALLSVIIPLTMIVLLSVIDLLLTVTCLDCHLCRGPAFAIYPFSLPQPWSTLKLIISSFMTQANLFTADSLRDKIGIVPQDANLFNESILDNVRYAKLHASIEEVHEACKKAAIHEKIMSFPDQYKSKVGNNGVKLSGGEKQRIAIARVILKNPGIVLLDEATSSVDTETEQVIQEAFNTLCKGRTTFIVA